MTRAKELFVSCALIVATIGCSSPEITSESSRNCREPENPYSEGTGHYAGFAWAEEKGAASCGGNSDSFIEGCEEYLRQVHEYEKCMKK